MTNTTDIFSILNVAFKSGNPFVTIILDRYNTVEGNIEDLNEYHVTVNGNQIQFSDINTMYTAYQIFEQLMVIYRSDDKGVSILLKGKNRREQCINGLIRDLSLSHVTTGGVKSKGDTVLLKDIKEVKS